MTVNVSCRIVFQKKLSRAEFNDVTHHVDKHLQGAWLNLYVTV